MENQKAPKKYILPIAAAVIVIAAAVTVFAPKLLQGADTPQDTTPPSDSGSQSAAGPTTPGAETAPSDSGTDTSTIVIDSASLSSQAAFYDYDANGTTVEMFAVIASDGSIRLALNTCQVCNGSPYAYFVQDGDYFVCQNCGSSFAATQIGEMTNSCSPVAIPEDYYTIEDGIITISPDYLIANAFRFTNWKKF